MGNRLTLLLEEDLDEVAAAAGRLRALLPLVVVDTLVERFPQVLDVDDFELAMQVWCLWGGRLQWHGTNTRERHETAYCGSLNGACCRPQLGGSRSHTGVLVHRVVCARALPRRTRSGSCRSWTWQPRCAATRSSC